MLPTGERKDAGPGVDWRAELVYPGLRRGEKLRRETSLPPRATIEARDGTAAGQGPGPRVRPRTDRQRSRGHDRARARRPARPSSQARGVPDGAAVGLTGLEREFDERLTGTPGGVLFAGKRVLANVKRQGRAARCARRSTRRSSAPRSRRSPAATAGSRSSGPPTARCSRWPGSPPARRSRPARPSRSSRSPASCRTRSPSASRPTRSRTRRRSRASRSRTPTASPAAARSRSPSRTPATASSRRWAPSSARRSSSGSPRSSASTRSRRSPARRAARSPPRPRSATTSPSARPRSARARCSRRRCRWRVVGATIGNDGVRAHPTLLKGADPQRVRATSKSVARTIKSYMRTVVTDGTGGAAALDGIKVSGKTGTAELRTTVKEEPPPEVTDPNAAAARGRHDRHRRLVRRVRALPQADDRRLGDARRPGRRRRHRRARGRRRPQGRAD